MLKDNYDITLSPLDEIIFDKLIPQDHYLRRLKATIDFTPCRALVAPCYSPNLGRGALDPLRLLKLLVLQFHYGLSDESVIRQTQVNVAFRFFLDLPLDFPLPEPSLLSQFRTRLTAERFTQIFQEILGQARAAGLVKDRLRLKDATHVLANIAVPATIELVAQMRTRLLNAAQCFAPEEVAAHQKQAQEIRLSTSDLSDEARLLSRVEHLREIVEWVDQQLESWETRQQAVGSQQQVEKLKTDLNLAHKVLRDRPTKASDKLLSLTDVDARRNKHGQYYDGYLLDVSMDADSELICGIDVLAANGDEAANAVALIESEEAAHKVDIENMSMDAIGYNGAVIEKLSDDEQGPQLTVWVSPKEQPPRHPDLYQPEDFTLNEEGNELKCPAGERTRARNRDSKDHGWNYRFSSKQCNGCPLREKCLAPEKKGGRTVSKNDFRKQYEEARERATTEEYKKIKKEHPAIERKLNELVRWHGGRRVRYRGRLRVRVQYVILGIVVNCKRIVRLMFSSPSPQPA